MMPRPVQRLVAATALALLLASPALPCEVPANAAALRSEVIALTNLQRKKQGLAPVAEQAALAKAAQAHACDNATTRTMSHRGSDGSALPDRLARVGYRYRAAAENVAAGFRDAPSVMSGWMGSSGHRRNILTGPMRDIGIGVARGADGQLYWAMNLGRSGG